MKKGDITVTFPCIETGIQNFHHRVKKFTHIELGWKKQITQGGVGSETDDPSSPLHTSVGLGGMWSSAQKGERQRVNRGCCGETCEGTRFPVL